MSISNGIISAPISVNDPYDLLGVPKQPSGYDVGYICNNAHERINICAKKKPVKYPEFGILSDDKYNFVNYGVVTPDCDFRNPINDYWKYSYPTGGYNEPFRLTDFVGYNHNAKPPISFVFNTKSIEAGDPVTCTLIFHENESGFNKSNNITLSDIIRRNDLKFTFCLFDGYFVREYVKDFETALNRIAKGATSYTMSCTSRLFKPGQACMARIMLTDYAESGSISSGYSLAITPKYDFSEFNFISVTADMPPITVGNNLDVYTYIQSDVPEFAILERLIINFSTGDPKVNRNMTVYVECNSIGGKDDTPRSIQQFDWNVSQSRVFTKDYSGMDLGNRIYDRKERSDIGGLYENIFIQCTVWGVFQGDSPSNRKKLGEWMAQAFER